MALKTNYNSKNMLVSMNKDIEAGSVAMMVDMVISCKTFLKDTREQVQDHSQGTYIDRTKQLRGSLAAYVFRDGVVVWSDEGQNGQQSRRVIDDMVPIVSKGFSIIGVASKEYASHVESKGYNVITRQGDTFIFNLEKAFYKHSR